MRVKEFQCMTYNGATLAGHPVTTDDPCCPHTSAEGRWASMEKLRDLCERIERDVNVAIVKVASDTWDTMYKGNKIRDLVKAEQRVMRTLARAAQQLEEIEI